MNYPIWRQQLVRSLHLHRSKPEARYFQVASINSNGLANIRTMVFRGFQNDSHTLLAVSDTRSDKIRDWEQHPHSQVHWYFAKSREQYRISCGVTVLKRQNKKIVSSGMGLKDDDLANTLYESQWKALSVKAQLAFYSPPPKSDLRDNPAYEVLKDEIQTGEPSQHFAVIAFHPWSVDYLDLKPTPHIRELHALDKEQWIRQAVNP